ncbi:MAG TPA: hypothetical protein VN040_01015 [Pseudosphingobacterium sp.]|nr:hypothetical protein [Pseudosphingobacterium sp.]
METLNLLLSYGVTITYQGKEIYVLEEFTKDGEYASKWVNATNWTSEEAMDFLGY